MNDAAFTPSMSAAQGFRNNRRLPALFWAAHSRTFYCPICAMLSINDREGPKKGLEHLPAAIDVGPLREHPFI